MTVPHVSVIIAYPVTRFSEFGRFQHGRCPACRENAYVNSPSPITERIAGKATLIDTSYCDNGNQHLDPQCFIVRLNSPLSIPTSTELETALTDCLGHLSPQRYSGLQHISVLHCVFDASYR